MRTRPIYAAPADLVETLLGRSYLDPDTELVQVRCSRQDVAVDDVVALTLDAARSLRDQLTELLA